MKRLLMATAGLAAVGLALAALAEDGRGQGQGYPVPGMGGASGPASPPYLPTSPPLDLKKIPRTTVPEEWRAPHEDPGMNRDILVTEKQGAWMIYVTSYSGPKGPSMARELVGELRGPGYKLGAYVFNYGEEEQRKELERVRQEVERRRATLRQAGLSGDVPIRVPRMRVEVECGVLVGGYKDFDAARRDLERIKKLPPLDPNRVKLPGVLVGEMPDPRFEHSGGYFPGPYKTKVQSVPLNVFLRAIVVRNPSMPQGPQERDKLDIAVLRRLNADESYSLLSCRKPYTIAVKHFALPTVIEQTSSVGNFWNKLGLGGKSNEHVDAAGQSAHNLAELLRKGRWEAYVLHMRYASIVCVGGYDRPDDPRLLHDQQALAELSQRLVSHVTNPPQSSGAPPMQLSPIAPMEVPH